MNEWEKCAPNRSFKKARVARTLRVWGLRATSNEGPVTPRMIGLMDRPVRYFRGGERATTTTDSSETSRLEEAVGLSGGAVDVESEGLNLLGRASNTSSKVYFLFGWDVGMGSVGCAAGGGENERGGGGGGGVSSRATGGVGTRADSGTTTLFGEASRRAYSGFTLNYTFDSCKRT